MSETGETREPVEPSKPNEYARLGEIEVPDVTDIVRSARGLEVYKQYFGEELGRAKELILDAGAGDSDTAERIAELPDHHATVYRLDADYADTPPEGSEPYVAADVANIPFEDASFDRVISFWLLPHLGREKGAQAISEMLRVVKADGQIMLFPARPIKRVESDHARKVYGGGEPSPFQTLVITKPEDYEEWDEAKKSALHIEMANHVTYGKVISKAARATMAQLIKRAGTHRTTEKGSDSSLF